MNAGLVSVIIPVFNRPAMLKQAVSSVAEQLYRPIQLIIVDDGSTDTTNSIATDLIAELAKYNLSGQLVMIGNSGPGLARQAGVEQAQGEFIQFLDSDDLLKPDKISTQVDGLNQNPLCGVSYCVQELCTMTGDVLDPAWMRSDEQYATMFPAMLAGRLWGTPVPLYRKSVVNQAGAWSDLLSEEDWEYDCRVASLNIHLHYAPQTLVTIRQHSEIHFGQTAQGDSARKLKDKSRAYQFINGHAASANIDQRCREFVRFRRMAFHVCRQCGAAGLATESEQLFQSVLHDQASSVKEGFILALYRVIAMTVGWARLGKWSASFDNARSKLSS